MKTKIKKNYLTKINLKIKKLDKFYFKKILRILFFFKQ
jgi:hypothetical protein